MVSYKSVTHVIFDLDGLLLAVRSNLPRLRPYAVRRNRLKINVLLILDTEVIYKKSIEDLLAQYGKTYSWELRDKIMGTVEQDTARIIVEELHLPVNSEQVQVELKKLQRETLKQAQLLPGAQRLICHLHDNGIPIAVATSSGKENVEIKLSKHQQLFNLFHHIVMGSSDEEVKNGKPAPDIFLVCASRFKDNPSPNDCLVFEDAPNGVKAARAAGMQVVMVPDDHVKEELMKPATQVLKSLLDFQPELFGLPHFSD